MALLVPATSQAEAWPAKPVTFIVCFPPGEEGAHQVRNESAAVARFAMPSSWAGEGYVAIRPDSNTALIVGPGFRRIVPLDEDLGYWDREPRKRP